MSVNNLNSRPTPDDVLVEIADYVCSYEISDPGAYRMARLCLMDAMGCAIKALKFEECTRLLGPVVPGALFTGGARVPGTSFVLDPVSAAFNMATMIRWRTLMMRLPPLKGATHPITSERCSPLRII